MPSLNFSPSATISSRLLPSSAAAPTTLMNGMQPPSPRLSSMGVWGPCAMSSWITISFTFRPAFAALRSALFALMRSPLWLSVTSSTPAGRLNISSASNTFSPPGAAKMSPATDASSMPSPTKPSSAGSWPVPPSVTMATLSAGFGFARTTIRSFFSASWFG